MESRFEPRLEIRRWLDVRKALHENQAAPNECVVTRALGTLSRVLPHLVFLECRAHQIDVQRVSVSKLSTVHSPSVPVRIPVPHPATRVPGPSLWRPRRALDKSF